MTTLDHRHTDPTRRSRPDRGRWLRVVGVVVVVAVLSLGLALLFREHDGNVLDGSRTVRGSGVAASEIRNLPPFTAVVLAGSNNVTVQVGAPRSVVVYADDNLIRHVRTTVRSGALFVETTGSFSTRAPMRVSVVVPELTSVDLTGSGNVVVDGVDSSHFTATLPGSGTLLVAGHTGHLHASLQGSGEMSMHGLLARAAQVWLSGSGEIQVYASDSLEAEVSGSGTILYAGNPAHLTTSVPGSGAVEPG